jgi:magnesium-transporting ATPase (P-type)
MFTVSMALGSLELGRRGVLVTRLSAAEDAANMDMLCADKTGTLTLNRLSLDSATPQSGFSADDVVRYGALASNAANQDPIDLAFLEAGRQRGLIDPTVKVTSFMPFSAATRRTEAIFADAGKRRRAVKGALRTVAEMAGLDHDAIAALEARAVEDAVKGYRTLAVALAVADGPLRLAGVVLLHDPIRPDSRALIDQLKALGVGVKMLTGDALAVARESARSLGLGEIVRAPALKTASDAEAQALIARAGGFAEVYPEDKFKVVKSLQAQGQIVGMTGDGVNDAPALRQAEIGVAVSGATDVAKGAASVVLTTEGLAGIVDLVREGRAIYQRVLTWIVNKVSRTILKSGFVVVAFLASGKFVISALGMVLLVFMTDFVKIALATDRVRPSEAPETWNIGPLVSVAALLGVLMLVEALGLLAFVWRGFALSDGQLQTFSFQTLFFFALFSLISIRERRGFWSSRPSATLSVALLADACAGMLVGAYGLGEMRPLPLAFTALIIAFAFICGLVVNDAIKVALIGQRLSKQ